MYLISVKKIFSLSYVKVKHGKSENRLEQAKFSLSNDTNNGVRISVELTVPNKNE